VAPTELTMKFTEGGRTVRIDDDGTDFSRQCRHFATRSLVPVSANHSLAPVNLVFAWFLCPTIRYNAG
jgi:hypothetical protein